MSKFKCIVITNFNNMKDESKYIKKMIGGSFNHITTDGLKYEVGTIDKKDCKSIYVELKCWLTTSISVDELIKLFKKRLRLKQHELTYGTFGGLIKGFFTSFDFAETKFHGKPGGTTYFILEVTLMADGRFDWYDKTLQGKLKGYGDDLYQLLKDIEVDFIFSAYSK